MTTRKELKNLIFERWKVLEFSHKGENNGLLYWKCRCSCAKKTIKNIVSTELLRGNSKSCGCLTKEKRSTHGYTGHQLYNLFTGIKRRCYPKSKSKNDKYYKDKGVTICDEWLDDPGKFVNWAKENGYKRGLQIDRIDSNREYSPFNCRFVTSEINSQNRGYCQVDKFKVNRIREFNKVNIKRSKILTCFNITANVYHKIISNRTWKNIIPYGEENT